MTAQFPMHALRRFARAAPAAEQCELCSAALAEDHSHLVEPARRQLLCACEACAVLFSGQAGMKYRRVPRRIRFLPGFRLSDAAWQDLAVPTGLAFFFRSSASGKIAAVYPSPGGPTESALDPESWDPVVVDNPVVGGMEPDTEALLVDRIGPAREYYLVGIDQCYRLVGLVRAHWRGLSGGPAVWEEIGRFFAALKERSESAGERVDA